MNNSQPRRQTDPPVRQIQARFPVGERHAMLNSDVAKGRHRPKIRLPSYLSTHRALPAFERPDLPFFDWSSLNGKDEVYNPNTEHMCNTILKQILSDPSTPLPAQYNTFLLHILEDHR